MEFLPKNSPSKKGNIHLLTGIKQRKQRETSKLTILQIQFSLKPFTEYKSKQKEQVKQELNTGIRYGRKGKLLFEDKFFNQRFENITKLSPELSSVLGRLF